MKPQKKREHYFRRKYNTLERFISYFYQLDLVTSCVDPGAKILEVGVGSGLVSDHLRKAGFAVTTCDFDASLKPDVVADTRALPFADNDFEIVTAFEVLEHVLFEDLPRALGELKRVSSRFVVASLPYRSSSFEFTMRFPLIRTMLKKDFVRFFVRIPLFFKGFQSSGQHYWEIDGYNYRLGKVKKILKKHFTRVKIIRPVLDGYRLFFVLEK